MSSFNSKSTSKALFKNTGIIAIGQISTKIISFLLLPLYTALLTTEDYGILDLLSTYATLIAVFVGLQLNQALFRFLVTSRNDIQKAKMICSTVWLATISMCVIYALIFCCVQPFIDLSFKWFLLLQVISTIYLQVISGMVRGLGNNTLYAVGNFISATVTLILNVVILVILHLGVSEMLLSYIIGPLIGGTVLFFAGKLYHYISIKNISTDELKRIIKYAVPLVPNELSWSLIHSSDRMIISAILSVAANGLIAVASKFSYVYTTAFSIFNTAWTEQVVLHYKDKGGQEYICKMFEKMILLFGSFSIGIIACMPFVFEILVDKQYSDAYGLVPFYMIAVFFNAVIGMISAIYLVENETKQVAVSTSAAAVVNIVVDLALIKFIGIYAAPISSICGYAAISIWRLIDVNRRHCKVSMEIKKLFILFSMLVVSMLGYYINSLPLEIASLLYVIVIALLINREFLKELKTIVIK